MKRVVFLISAPVILLISLLIFGFVWWKSNSGPVSADQKTVRLVIPKGYGASQIAGKLSEQKLIKNSLAFKIYVQATGVAGKIQAGEYDLAQNLSLPKLVSILLKGPTSVWITIPEGLRREEIVIRFADGLTKTDSERKSFIDEFLDASNGKEGFLFPDTYLLPKDITAEKVVIYQLSIFEKKTAEIMPDIQKGDLSLNEIITLASLIEREAKGNEERPTIAGILLKRIAKSWPLQVDAAVQYAVSSDRCQALSVKCNWWPSLTKGDLEIKSPFNTYKNTGLPPTPIASPGLSSIKAAVYPQDSDFWFYLHDEDGQIHYAETIEEHNANISKYLGK